MKLKKTIVICICAALALLAAAAALISVKPQAYYFGRGAIEKIGDKLEKRVPVLLYHHLYAPEQQAVYGNNPMALPVGVFAEQMKLLADNGYQTITADELYRFLTDGAPLPKKCVMVTFDDGYESNCVYAYPVLKQYGFKAVIFAETSKIIWEDCAFDPAGLQRLRQKSMAATGDVFTFASHSHAMHWQDEGGNPVLTTKPADEVLKDMETSRDVLGTDIYAYPYGAYNGTVIDLLGQAGYKMSFLNKAGRVTKRTHPFKIPRYTIYQNNATARFKNTLGLK